MKEKFIYVATLGVLLFLGSCRETEMNTDGDMEKQEVNSEAVEKES